MKLIKISCDWHDIYGWGQGFYSHEKQRLWEEFWHREVKFNNLLGDYILVKGDNFGGCDNLYNKVGSVYLHPMGFNTVFATDIGVLCSVKINGHYYEYEFDTEIEQLYKMCKACAEYCGSTFNFKVSKIMDIDNLKSTIPYTDRNAFIEQCGKLKE